MIPGNLTLTTLRLAGRPPRDTQTLHAAVAAATCGTRVLWAHPAPGVLIIQADGVPDRTRLPPARITRVTSMLPLLDALTAGQPIQWALIANPTSQVGKHRPDGTPSTRPGRRPLPPDRRPAWLHRKLDAALTITALQHQPLPAATGVRAGGRITLARHLFTGRGIVGDPVRLTGLVRDGVGSGKGYGCGLLLVRGVS